jgi:glycerol kinase
VKKHYVLAIDQGTTGSRAIVYDKEGKKVASAYEEFRQYFPKPGWVEHDPEEIWGSVYTTIKKVLAEVPRGSIDAIGITNQRETTLVWERDTGEPVYNAIVWQCRRTAGRCAELKKSKDQVELFAARTGLPVDAYFSATKIEWILENVPSARERAKNGRLLFGTTDAWVLWKLTGGAVHATDFTNASRTMLLNIEKRTWDDEILQIFGIPGHMLPEVRSSSAVFGKTIKMKNVDSGIPISGIAGDQQAALFGQNCFEPGSIKNTYGTGCFLLLNSGLRRPVSRYGLITTLGCDGRGKSVYVLEGAIFIAGAALQWLRDGLQILPSAAESEAMANSVEDTGGVFFVPSFVGLGAPYWDPDARGSMFGITRGTRAQHIVRAALEAMCYQTRDVLEAMRKDTGLNISSLKVDGGAVENNFLCQFQSDILGIEVIRPQDIEITALGAAYLAGLAVGYWTDAQEIKKCWKCDTVFRPSISKKRADDLYAGWSDAVRRTLSRQ